MKSYSITTFGCQMNASDSERIQSVCKNMGYTSKINDDFADLYIINTCSIRQKAEDRVIGMGKKFIHMKAKKPELKVIITGCMVKRDLRQKEQTNDNFLEKYLQKLKRQMPWVDHFVEINKIHELPKLLNIKVEEKIEDYFSIKPKYNSRFQAFVPISTGCNKFCTFCIVPFTRGKEISRDYTQIYKEVSELVNTGFKEITLLGQNVNSWRKVNKLRTPITKLEKEKNEEDFSFLLQSLAQIEGDFWLRFTSSHPYDINMKLIDIVATEKSIAKQFHFALQSGSNSVLKRMNRYYTREEFKEKVLEIKNKIPGVSITTDVIVGFCGETEEEFQDTVDLCEELEFDQIYISEYSQREGTIASKFYTDDILKSIKSRRKLILDEVLKKGVEKNNQKLIGTVQKILLYKNRSKNKVGIYGRTTGGKEVMLIEENYNKRCHLELGQFTDVVITGFKGFALEAKVM